MFNTYTEKYTLNITTQGSQGTKKRGRKEIWWYVGIKSEILLECYNENTLIKNGQRTK